jgi:transposase
MKITTLGIDLAKNVFQLHGVDETGREVLRKRLSRGRLLGFLANLKPCLIGIEACGGAHYWAREMDKLGHTVRIMSAQYVKPYINSNKNDSNDAQGICEAVSRPHMHFVPSKSVEQQDIQALHRVREQLIKGRTALANQTRELLAEYGIVVPKGVHKLRAALPGILEDGENGLTPLAREVFAESYEQLLDFYHRIDQYNRRIEKIFQASALCQRAAPIEGVGPLVATALVAAVGDAKVFKNGRQMAAWLGLVPKQHSSGGRNRLMGISKRGDRYLRTLLIHGARSVVYRCDKKENARYRWLRNLKQRRGANRACVALANKNARILWALLSREEAYRPAA